jgi:hypothetical protein
MQTLRRYGRGTGVGGGWLFLAWVCGVAVTGAGAEWRPMSVVEEDTAWQRWLAKPVLARRLVDGMERTNAWSFRGPGSMEWTEERSVEGRRSLRLRSPTKTDKPNPVAGRPFGESAVRREVEHENWEWFNRLSVWVYPHLPGFNVISMLVKLHNEGRERVPDVYGREGLQFVLLKPDQWNEVAFETPHLSRDRVTAVELIYRLQGNEPGATEVVQFDFDRLELQRVDADLFEGWEVAPGRIAYSHSGYERWSRKRALSAGLGEGTFRVLDARSGKLVYEGEVEDFEAAAERDRELGAAGGGVGWSVALSVPARSARLQVLDFTGFNRAGLYVVEAGGLRTRSFPIGDDVWRSSVVKTLNTFRCQRCGTAVPGIHGVCHEDWRAQHGEESMVINGGWHDAGDLSQGLVNTAEATMAMLELAGRLGNRDRGLRAELIEEAKWGLEWIHKTRFADGHRVTWATMDFWTDGVLGTADDVLGEVRDRPFENYLAAAAEAMGARVLPRRDGSLAARSLELARLDWAAAEAKAGMRPGVELASAGVMAAVELYRATREAGYLERAIEMARGVVASQQRRSTAWDRPAEGLRLAGYYYTGPDRERILHYSHRGHEQAPAVALAALCELAPDHPEWMDWYSSVMLHSEYLTRAAMFTAPYDLLPASIYSRAESKEARFQEQLDPGVQLDERHALRVFPVWYDFRGNSGTILSQAKVLGVAARLRNAGWLWAGVEAQLEWHVGRNPFGQSLMFGEGHDYAPQYTAMSGDMVGSLPVGVQTRRNHDVPYWPAANCYNYKEVWVHPSSRWLSIMADLEARRWEQGVVSRDLVLSAMGFEEANGEVEGFRVEARGRGGHRLALRSSNLAVASPVEQRVRLVRGEPLMVRWAVRVVDDLEPVVVVVVPDGDLGRSRDHVRYGRIAD